MENLAPILINCNYHRLKKYLVEHLLHWSDQFNSPSKQSRKLTLKVVRLLINIIYSLIIFAISVVYCIM